MNSDYKKLLQSIEKVEQMEKKARLPKATPVPANLKRLLNQSKKRGETLAFLKNNERNIWQSIYNQGGEEAFSEVGFKPYMDPPTFKHLKPKVSTVQARNNKLKFNAYVKQLLESENTNSNASDPGPATPPPPPKLTNFVVDDYFRGGKTRKRPHKKRLGCRFTRKH
jgi:hypothetical protein